MLNTITRQIFVFLATFSFIFAADVNLTLDADGSLLYESTADIYGFQFSVDGVDVIDAYDSFEVYVGKKFNNKKIIPNIGTNLSYSITPAHSESKYYSWEEKHVANFSVDLSDEFIIVSKTTLY